MKLLVILPGTPVSPAQAAGKACVQLETLTEGTQYFYKPELINNLQSVEGLRTTGNIDITIRSFSQRKNPAHLLKAGREIKKLVKQLKPDAVYVFWGGISGWVITLFSEAPVVLCLLGSDLMGSYTLEGKKTGFGKTLAFFTRLACAKARGIVLMSEKMKQLLDVKQQQKILVLPEGVDLEKFYSKDKIACRKLLGWNENDAVVLFFNSGAYVKNAPLATAAFQIAKEKIPNAVLVEVMNVPHDELLNYYNAADLLLLTSFHEGSNNSIKEALACNCPVVSTDAGDALQRLEDVHPSFCVKEYEANALAEKMVMILSAPERSNGREKVMDVSVENIGRKLRNYLDGLLRSQQSQ